MNRLGKIFAILSTVLSCVGCPGQTVLGNGTLFTGGLAVQSVNNLGGAIALVGDSTVSVTQSGQNIEFHATGAAIAHVTNILKGDGAGNAIGATGSTNGTGDFQLPITVACTGTGISCSLVGTTWTIVGSGAAGSGAVNSAAEYQMGCYPGSGTTIGGCPGLYAIPNTASSSQLTTLLGGLGTGNSAVIPAGFPEVPFTNSNVPVKDHRLGKEYVQASGYGISCDARTITISFSSGTTAFTVVGGGLSAADIGKTVSIGFTSGGYNGTQYSFLPTIATQAGSSGTFSTPTPAASGGNLTVPLGTPNDTAIANFMAALNSIYANFSSGAVGIFPAGCQMYAVGPINWNKWQSLLGQAANDTVLMTGPARDTFQTQDNNTGSVTQAGLIFDDILMIPDDSLDATRPITNISANGTSTSLTPVYRGIHQHMSDANNPCGPGYVTGSCQLYVANTTQNSALVCVPTALGRLPTVGQQVGFRDTPTAFTTTVASFAGSCTTGFSPVTMTAAFPNTSGYTLTQTEFVAGTSIQNLASPITAGAMTYPVTITLSNPITPVPATESNVAQSGRIKIGSEEYQYIGVTFSSPYTMILRNGPSTTVGWAASTAIFPMNPCYAKKEVPWPVTPTVNSGDSTPSGAVYFPGLCVGNAAVAMPEANGNIYVGTGFLRARLQNDICQTLGVGKNTACLYIQGNNAPYASTFSGWLSYGPDFGVAEGEAGQGQHGIAAVGPTGQGNHFEDWSIAGSWPMSFAGIQDSYIDRVDGSSTEINPFDGSNIGAAQVLYQGYSLDEQNGNVVQSTAGNHVEVFNVEPENGSHIENPVAVESDCPSCSYKANLFEGAGAYFGSTNQTVEDGQLSGSATNPVILYGSNIQIKNTITTLSGQVSNTYGVGSLLNWGAQNHVASPAGYGAGPITTVIGARETYDGSDGYAIDTGLGATPYVNRKSGYFSPDELGPFPSVDASPMTTAFTVDQTLNVYGGNGWVGCAVTSSTGCNPYHLDGFFGGVYIGNGSQRLAAINYAVTLALKTTSNQTLNFQIQALTPGAGCSASTPYNANVMVAGGQWNIVTLPSLVNLSGNSGCILGFEFDDSTSSDTLQVGYIDFTPVPGYVLIPPGTLTGGSSCSPPNSVQGSDNTNLYICDTAGIIKAVPMSGSSSTSTVCTATLTLSGSLTTGTQGVLATQTCTGATTTDTAICSTPTNAFTLSGFTPSSGGIVTINSQVTANTITINGENNTASTQTVSGPSYTCKVFR
jgi:hypothetical protein